MTSKYARSAVAEILDYLWWQLQVEGIFNPADYFIGEYSLGLVPIVPVQDQPELANQLGSLPYIVWDHYTTPTNARTEWWRRRGEIHLNVYSPDVSEIISIGEFLEDKFKKMDESARDINDFIGPQNPFIFHCVEFMSFETYRPAKSEGGRTVGEAIISYEYVRDEKIEPTNLLFVDSAGATSSHSV